MDGLGTRWLAGGHGESTVLVAAPVDAAVVEPERDEDGWAAEEDDVGEESGHWEMLYPRGGFLEQRLTGCTL